MTTEAQQALLKLFEEPQKGTLFILLAPLGSIIATLRSRFVRYPEILEGKKGSTFTKKFLALSQKERSIEVAKLLKDEEGIKERVGDFLNELEALLHKNIAKSREVRKSLEDIAKIRSYANDRSPSFKMLLEHLALSLPKV